MSYLSNPQPVTGALITLTNPGTVQNSTPPVAVQLRNASGYVLSVVAGGVTKMIDPFTATTFPVDTGGNVLANPSFNAYSSLSSSGYLSAEWLLANEQPSEPDGPLTSAATIATALNPITGFQVLLNSPAANRGTGYTSAVIPVNNSEQALFLLDYNSATTGDKWIVTWYADAAGTIQLATQQWNKSGSQVSNSVALAVYGPYLKFQYIPNGANNTNVAIKILGYGTTQPLNPSMVSSLALQSGLLMDVQNQVVANNSTWAQLPNLFTNGEIDLFGILSTFNVNVALGIDVWTGGAWDILTRPAIVATGEAAPNTTTINPLRFTLPFSDWRVSVPNFSGAAINFYTTIVGRHI